MDWNSPDIDWNELWRESRRRQSWQGRSAGDWDRRAGAFLARHRHSPYTDLVLSRLHLDPNHTLLDIGCGPGNLALPLAAKVRQVTAMDFSATMLTLLKDRAQDAGITNLQTIQAALEDDWQQAGITRHDVILASRALASVDDLRAVLEKIDHWAKKEAIIVERVAPSPFDPDIFRAVGRPFHPGPDYIFIVNLLYQTGITVTVDFLTMPGANVFADPDQAVESLAWMLGEMTAEEETRLRQHLAGRLRQMPDGWHLDRQPPPHYAVLRWKKSSAASS